MTKSIYGIPSTVRNPEAREAIRVVLKQIRKRAPKDFSRIRKRVVRFANLKGDPVMCLDMGIDWGKLTATVEGRFKPVSGKARDFEGLGIVELSGSRQNPVSTIAHELGHACTREKDFYDRMMNYDDVEVILELCATYYEYKWGFGKHVRTRPGIYEFAPNSLVEFGDLRFRVTRTFRLRRI